MPEITLFGWFHTIIGIAALLTGASCLISFKIIRSDVLSGKVYLICTIAAAASALGIYKHGGFGPAHALAVMTLLAVAVGATAERTGLFGRASRYLQAAAYSFTFLAHMIPAVTDGLLRLPVDAPVVSTLDDPLLRGSHLGLIMFFLIGLGLQILWLRRNPAS